MLHCSYLDEVWSSIEVGVIMGAAARHEKLGSGLVVAVVSSGIINFSWFILSAISFL